MVAIEKELRKENLKAKLLMQVHDELVVECPDTESKKVDEILKKNMEHIVQWDIPLSVEIGVGENWLEAKK
jgi:DNA polymerase-1